MPLNFGSGFCNIRVSMNDFARPHQQFMKVGIRSCNCVIGCILTGLDGTPMSINCSHTRSQAPPETPNLDELWAAVMSKVFASHCSGRLTQKRHWLLGSVDHPPFRDHAFVIIVMHTGDMRRYYHYNKFPL